jgi:hypothetical protein
MISFCPKVEPSCNRFDVEKASPQNTTASCKVLAFVKGSTTCACDLNPAMPPPNANRTSGRRLDLVDTADTILDETGTADLVGASIYLGQDFKNTFSAADDLNAADGGKRALIVILLFCTLWGGGLIALIIVHIRESYIYQAEARMSKKPSNSLAEMTKEQIMLYIDLIMPAVYNGKENVFHRTMREIGLHHRYFHLFSVDSRRKSLIDRLYRTVKILTVQTTMMFIQAVLFDLQNPSDDGTCYQYATEYQCLSRKTPLDSSISYCSWELIDYSTRQQFECVYADPKFSQQAVIYVMVITAICTSVCKLPMDFLLKKWVCPVIEKDNAPTKNDIVNPSRQQKIEPNAPKRLVPYM